MSEPTQAQIEAAAKAMVAYEEEWGEKFPEGRPWDWTELATTALTAAAQVGEEDSFLFNQSTRLAAAQVADEEKQYAAALDTSKYQITNEDIATIVETTIERCAQVAENHFEMEYEQGYGQTIATAIRALKDKP